MQMLLFFLVRVKDFQKLLVRLRIVFKAHFDLIQELDSMIKLPWRNGVLSISHIAKKCSGGIGLGRS